MMLNQPRPQFVSKTSRYFQQWVSVHRRETLVDVADSPESGLLNTIDYCRQCQTTQPQTVSNTNRGLSATGLTHCRQYRLVLPTDRSPVVNTIHSNVNGESPPMGHYSLPTSSTHSANITISTALHEKSHGWKWLYRRARRV